MPQRSVTVVIATLGRPEPLRRALDSLGASQRSPDAILVVDGDSRPEAVEVVRQAAASGLPVRHVTSARGLTTQRNTGLAEVTTDVVLYLDDDARVRPDALEKILAAYDDPAVVGATGRVVEPASNRVGGKASRARVLLRAGGRDGTFMRCGYPRRLVDEGTSTDVEFMQGCFMSARTDVARLVRFDEQLTGYGLAEDEDFSYRLSRSGRIRYVADAVVDHDNAGFGSRDRRGFGHQVVRNRSYLFRKNFPQDRRARAEFSALMALLVVHRLLNRDVLGARGLVEGATGRAGPPLHVRLHD